MLNPTVFYVDSYHDCYPPSEQVIGGLRDVLRTKDIRLHVFFADSRHINSSESAHHIANRIMSEIERIKPDIIVAHGNAAVRDVVAKRFADGPIPCVFCGVKWSCRAYGLPTRNVTGILEIPPVEQAIALLRKHYPDADSVAILSPDSSGRRRYRKYLDPIWRSAGLKAEYLFVDTYEAWRKQLVEANRSADVIYLPAHDGLRDWDEPDAAKFVTENLSKPAFTCDYSMVRCSMFGLIASPAEQGEWAARTALGILEWNWKGPESYPVARGKKTQAYLNQGLAETLGFEPGEEFMANCHVIE